MMGVCDDPFFTVRVTLVFNSDTHSVGDTSLLLCMFYVLLKQKVHFFGPMTLVTPVADDTILVELESFSHFCTSLARLPSKSALFFPWNVYNRKTLLYLL